MNSIFIYSMLFLWGLKTYCCENQPILHLPFQQTMSITPYPVPQYHVPEKTLPIVEHAVLHRIDQAIIELHKENFQPSLQALSKTAAHIAHNITQKRIIGVASLSLSFGATFISAGSLTGMAYPQIPLAFALIGASGTVLFCDSMLDCCCWQHKVSTAKELIKKHDEKVN